MPTIVLKVPEKIPAELDVIQEEEGLGNRTSTVTFLIKYYFLTKRGFLHSFAQKKQFAEEDDLKGFSALGTSSFGFWDNPEDDIYQQFYSKRK